MTLLPPPKHRSIRRARRLATVTATPATTNHIVFGIDVPMECDAGEGDGAEGAPFCGNPPTDDGQTAGGGAVAAPAAAPPHGNPFSLASGPGGGGGGDESSVNGGIADTARRWYSTTAVGVSGGVSGGGGGPIGGSEMVGVQDDDDGEEDSDGDEGEDEDEDGWWAGAEFEGDWSCLFEAYCPEGSGGRMPGLVAREVRERSMSSLFSFVGRAFTRPPRARLYVPRGRWVVVSVIGCFLRYRGR